MIEKWDGHTHSRFCPHGTDAELDEYLDQAVELGFAKYTITEHAPLPGGPMSRWRASRFAMDEENLPAYFDAALRVKEHYADRIEVLVGLELDYLPGQEGFSRALVDRWLGHLDEVLISVHFLPGEGGMRCICLSREEFEEGLLGYHGTMEAVVEWYFDHVEAAIDLAGELPIPVRLAHPTLIEAFRLVMPPYDEAVVERRLRKLLPKLRDERIGLDANASGLRAEFCRKAYPPGWFVRECLASGIRSVFGSDAHRPSGVGQGWDWFEGLYEG